MCIKKLAKVGNQGWMQIISYKMKEIENVNSFVIYIKDLDCRSIFKYDKDYMEVLKFINMYLQLYVKCIEEMIKNKEEVTYE